MAKMSPALSAVPQLGGAGDKHRLQQAAPRPASLDLRRCLRFTAQGKGIRHGSRAL
jgi:hypothetical protein